MRTFLSRFRWKRIGLRWKRDGLVDRASDYRLSVNGTGPCQCNDPANQSPTEKKIKHENCAGVLFSSGNAYDGW
jgi:hypothetical protein